MIEENSLVEVSKNLKKATLQTSDFEPMIDQTTKDDFIFLDPPYTPGETEMRNGHYQFNTFSFSDHLRLAKALKRATNRGVKWLMTNSSHPTITKIFEKYDQTPFSIGTGPMPGILIKQNVGEILISN